MADPKLTPDARGHIALDHAERELRAAVHAAFRAYLTTVEHAVLDRVTSGNLTAADDPDLNLWPPVHVWRRLVEQHILPTWRRLWTRAWNRFLRKPQRAELDENDYIRAHLDDATQRLTGAQWPDAVYTAVRDQIQAGWSAGEDLRSVRRRVRQVLGPDQWTGRADTVARSESLAAVNGGTFRAGQARQDVFAEQLYKRWSSVHDDRVRHAHREADGQVVRYDEPFTVGGEHLQFPHDPTGSPAEVANCRCVLLIEDADESRERSEAMAASDDPVTAAVKGHMPGALSRYWTHGKGAAKIRWGEKSDFYRCRRQLRKYVPAHMIDGACAQLHRRALGVWPGQEGAKKADAGGDDPPCPCDEMTDEQIEEALAAMRDDPDVAAELDEHQDDDTSPAQPDDQDDQQAVEDEGMTSGVFDIPADDEVDDDDLDDGDGNTVSAADFTPSGGPTAAKRKRATKNRHALPGGRFPIENTSDLRKAISALGRAKGGDKGRAAVKAHIIRRAKALGATNMLPPGWTGSSKRGSKNAPFGGKKAPPFQKKTAAAASGNAWYERVAETVPDHPPADWFADPELTGPTKIRVTADGRVYGHLAAWDTEHASLPGVTARMFASDPLHRFHRHPVRTADGQRVRTGPLATGGHASTDSTVGLTAAQAHYDDPAFVAADVVTGKDAHGLWAAGSLRPGVSPFQVMLLDRYSISGDWRNGELVAACSVSVPGFHLDDDAGVEALAADAGPDRSRLADHRPRAAFDDDGHPFALVAAGIVTDHTSPGPVLDGHTLYRQFLAAQREHEQATQARQRVFAAAFAPVADRIRTARHH